MVLNSVQGLFIFMMFTLKKQNMVAVKKKVSELFSEQSTLETNVSEYKVKEEKYTINRDDDSFEVALPK